MHLFHPKIIAKHAKPEPIPADHLSLIENWIKQIDNGTLLNLNEMQVQGAFTQQILCKLLGYQAVGEGDSYTVAREYPVAGGRVDVALGHFYGEKDASKNQVFAPFELKGADTKNLDALMPGRHKTPVQQAFEYARDIKGAKWVLLCNFIELRLYAVSETSLVYEPFFLKELIQPAHYARFQLLLGASNFLNNKPQQLLQESQQADKDISAQLYQDYKQLRETMLAHLIADNQEHSPESLVAPAQKLLDRVLFTAFAEDKGLIPDNSIAKAYQHQDPYNPKPIYQNFIGLFNAIDKGNSALGIPAYNGGLFASDAALNALNVSDALCEGFKNLAEYDFDSEVSVTVLGRIFEQSIADLEELTLNLAAGTVPQTSRSKASAVSGKRKQDGVVYTPDAITQFMVQNTLGRYIDEQFASLFSQYGQYKSDGSIQWKRGKQVEQSFWYAWQERLQNIKVVDPAVGSGAFMVAAFDYLLEEYRKINEKLAELTGQHSVLDLNKEILNRNLFGVDINAESIEITKLSLWLKTAERGKPLESLDANFMHGNSLGFDEPASGSDFTWQTAFPDVFAQGGFDVVLGNPPYVRQELFSHLKPWLEQNFSVYHGVLDLYGYFYELGYKLLKPQGKLGFISNSSFFKTSSGEALRGFLSQQVCLEQLVDFADIQVFEGVTTYPTIMVLSKQTPTAAHNFKALLLSDALPENLQQSFTKDAISVPQRQLGTSSWSFESQALFELRQKLTQGYNTLKETYGSPYRGVLTGLNEAFVIDQATQERLVKEDPRSSELLRPFLEGKDLKKWRAEARGLWLITMPKFWTREQLSQDGDISEAEAWQWLQNNYPAVTQWLEPFAEKARKRGDKGEFWWELRACAYYHEFEQPKIQYGHFSPEPLFHFNTNQAYSNDKSYIIPNADHYLYGLLNSSALWFLITSMCPAVRGGFYEVRAQYIETLPVPEKPIDETISALAEQCQSHAEQRYQTESRFARRLADLCPADTPFKLSKKLDAWWQLDFAGLQQEIKKAFKGQIPLAERNDWQDYFEQEQQKQARQSQQIARLEQQINQAVYQLFGLTPEEISLIEESI